MIQKYECCVCHTGENTFDARMSGRLQIVHRFWHRSARAGPLTLQLTLPSTVQLPALPGVLPKPVTAHRGELQGYGCLWHSHHPQASSRRMGLVDVRMVPALQRALLEDLACLLVALPLLARDTHS